MQIIDVPIDELVPYERNARRNDEAVGAVAASIKEFGFKVPIVIDGNNVIVAGHTRYKAAKLLDYPAVPCIVADDLTEQQVRAFRLADNNVAELAKWDWDLLSDELDTILDIDMADFGFHLDDIANFQFEEEEAHEEQKEATAEKMWSILNTQHAMYLPPDAVGPYDMPLLEPVYEVPDVVDEWITFNYVGSDEEPEHKGVCFFIHDYQFERVWNEPEKYAERLAKYPIVAAPDFSPMGGFPMATQIWNHYRKMWCAKFWQEHGVRVIPCITWSTDAASLDWFLDGVPEGGVVITSSMWTRTEEQLQDFKAGWRKLIDERHPCKVLVYGKVLDFMRDDTVVEGIDTFARKRFGGGA